MVSVSVIGALPSSRELWPGHTSTVRQSIWLEQKRKHWLWRTNVVRPILGADAGRSKKLHHLHYKPQTAYGVPRPRGRK